MKGLKIITAQEMVRIEALAIENGSCTQEAFMQQAGLRVAEAAEEWIDRHRLSKEVSLLVWKGNKAGDAFVAGIALLENGYSVRAYHLASIDQCTPLCKKFAEKFRKKGGEIIDVKHASDLNFGSEGLTVDGLLGTGFSGKVEGLLKAAIERANASGVPILSIDLPSGLNGTTGESNGAVIQAYLTMTMGLPKIGLFLRDGWNHVGELSVGDFGLPEEFTKHAEAVAYLPDWAELKKALPKVVRNRHKYQRGAVVGYAGSAHYSGAGKLSALAALRGGAGLVSLFYPASAEAEMHDAPPELIRMAWNERDWVEALQKAKAVFVGPGIGRGEEEFVKRVVPKLGLPIVLDADALLPDLSLPSVSICTPHRGEMLRLLGEVRLEEEELLKRTQQFCDEKQTVVVLKGAPTWIFVPLVKPFLMVHGDPGMATAGSGDVLTGLLASLLAQGCGSVEAALLGTMLHALAGESAAKEKTSHCLIASDLISHFPQAFRSFISI